VVFVDAYEALVGGVSRDGTAAQADGWLRDLLGQLERGLVVIASREPVGWQRHDPQWARRIRPVPVAALPFAARLELLAALGVDDPTVGQTIARDCDGCRTFCTWPARPAPPPARTPASRSGSCTTSRPTWCRSWTC
jgi:hypothetical protein